MNIAQLAQKLSELGVNQQSYRVENFGSGNSDAIILKKTEQRFEIFYTERGHNSLLASFQSESEACEYVLRHIEKEETAFAHNIGIFDTESQASTLASKLIAVGIRVKTDTIPVGKNSKRYRVFVFGRDVERVRKIRGW